MSFDACSIHSARVLTALEPGAGKTTAALLLAAEVGFDVLECGMEGSFTC